EHVLREGRTVTVEDVSMVDASSGHLRSISDSAAPVRDQGRLLGAVMVFRDVTEQKHLRKKVELTDRLAALGTMAAGVAHEVNNPLAAVLANATFIAEEVDSLRAHFDVPGLRTRSTALEQLQEIADAIHDVETAARRIGRIVGDLRAFARPPEPSRAQADVVRAVQGAIRMTHHELRQRARLRTSLEIVPLVEADESKLVQVFVNLLVNAAQ